jgi:hypothetical protein
MASLSVVAVSTSTAIDTQVPSGATTGRITVTIGCNTATSATDFIISSGPGNQPPSISQSTAAAQIPGIVTVDLVPLVTDSDRRSGIKGV